MKKSGINPFFNGELQKPNEADFQEILDGAKIMTEVEKAKIDFSDAKDLADLIEMIKKQGGVVNSQGERMSAEEVLVTIQTGHLEMITRSGNLRETARKMLLRQEFRWATSLEEVIEEIKRCGEIKGSKKNYSADEIIEFIKMGQLDQIPRTRGLRFVVEEFLKENKEKNN